VVESAMVYLEDLYKKHSPQKWMTSSSDPANIPSCSKRHVPTTEVSDLQQLKAKWAKHCQGFFI